MRRGSLVTSQSRFERLWQREYRPSPVPEAVFVVSLASYTGELWPTHGRPPFGSPPSAPGFLHSPTDEVRAYPAPPISVDAERSGSTVPAAEGEGLSVSAAQVALHDVLCRPSPAVIQIQKPLLTRHPPPTERSLAQQRMSADKKMETSPKSAPFITKHRQEAWDTVTHSSSALSWDMPKQRDVAREARIIHGITACIQQQQEEEQHWPERDARRGGSPAEMVIGVGPSVFLRDIIVGTDGRGQQLQFTSGDC